MLCDRRFEMVLRSMLRILGRASSKQDARLGRLLKRAFRFCVVGSTVFLAAGCATIAPRNVLPQADAAQIELEGFHNIRFWGDASTREIQAIMMADASKTEGRLSSGSKGIRRSQTFSPYRAAPKMAPLALDCWSAGVIRARGRCSTWSQVSAPVP